MCFIKFGEEKHLKELIDGNLYLNTINYFRQSEDKSVSDYNDGKSMIYQVSMTLEKDGKIIGYSNHGQLYFDGENKGNIFCVYSLFDDDIYPKKINKLDRRLFSLENKPNKMCLIITDVKEFLSRLKNSLKELNLNYKYGRVSYYNHKEKNGELGVFYKSNDFNYQKEWRLFIKNEKDEPMRIFIGSIKDISRLVEDCENLEIRCL